MRFTTNLSEPVTLSHTEQPGDTPVQISHDYHMVCDNAALLPGLLVPVGDNDKLYETLGMLNLADEVRDQACTGVNTMKVRELTGEMPSLDGCANLGAYQDRLQQWAGAIATHTEYIVNAQAACARLLKELFDDGNVNAVANGDQRPQVVDPAANKLFEVRHMANIFAKER